MKKFTSVVFSVLAITAIILTVARPAVYVASALEGLKMWALIVLPTLLPFFFLTAILSKCGLTDHIAKAFGKITKKVFNVGGIASYVFLMSVISGYPVGAKIICDLRKKGLITETEATKISTFCSTSGPLFIIGSVGVGMFGNKYVGFILFISHALSAVAVGIIFRFYGGDGGNNDILPLVNRSDSLYDCVYSSVVSVAVVGGFICVFYLFADMAENTGAILPLVKFVDLFVKDEKISSAFVSGLIECTRGCRNLSRSGISPLTVCLAESLISFGGVSVIFQSVAFLSEAKAKTAVFLLAKVIQTVLSSLICLFFTSLFL